MTNVSLNEFFNDISFEDYNIDRETSRYRYIIDYIKEKVIYNYIGESITDEVIFAIKQNIRSELDTLQFYGEIYDFSVDSFDQDGIYTINVNLRKSSVELKYINFTTTIMSSNNAF